MKLTFLGTGDAGGVPLFGCNCSICLQMKKDGIRRSPCSAVISFGSCSFLIDAGRTDLLALFDQYQFKRILLTHYHADHVQGLFHIRWGNPALNIPVHGPVDEQGCADLLKHPGILDFTDQMIPFLCREFNGISITPVPLNHSKLTLGYCFDYKGKRVAYLTDTLGLPLETESFLLSWQPDILILDCSHPPGHAHMRNHNDLMTALCIHNKISPAESWLTHIGHELELYWHAQGIELPSNVFIATDGYQLTVR
ncbi:phosphonate metabolism protein PhnP [Mariprofundus sp. EBB-1]|nr:phosphonate metabolism protein PhnP [Mariprofundus sp. EBB-1]